MTITAVLSGTPYLKTLMTLHPDIAVESDRRKFVIDEIDRIYKAFFSHIPISDTSNKIILSACAIHYANVLVGSGAVENALLDHVRGIAQLTGTKLQPFGQNDDLDPLKLYRKHLIQICNEVSYVAVREGWSVDQAVAEVVRFFSSISHPDWVADTLKYWAEKTE